MQRGIAKRTIALCLPGERFEGVWVDALMALYSHLVDLDFAILRVRVATPNVYITRDTIRRVLVNHPVRPDCACGWMTTTRCPSRISTRCLNGLDAHPEVDGVSGWCWIHNEHKQGFMPSCGEWAPDHLHWNPFSPSLEHETRFEAFRCGGLPCILMRFSALEKAGESASCRSWISGWNTAWLGKTCRFFLGAEKGGAKFLVDPQVRVPHLKYVEVKPVFPEEGKVPVKVACMMRVKNEARWIRHTIDSVRELCGDLIFVMEDGSTDDTRADCAGSRGAVVLDSPFVGQGLDEARDKNWFLDQVISRCHPDWILMPDGDEELEAGGCAKIRNALERNPPCDCFALRFLYFWDSIRSDPLGWLVREDGAAIAFPGQYGVSVSRATIPRIRRGIRITWGCTRPTLRAWAVWSCRSMWRCCITATFTGRTESESSRWIIGIDPHNEGEGFYRHCVQGDIPEVPRGCGIEARRALEAADLAHSC